MLRRIVLAAVLTALSSFVLRATASTPASHDVTIPTAAGQTVVVEWTGTAPPGSVGAGTNSCETGGPLEDPHTINLTVPAGAYASLTVTAQFHIEWDTGSGLSDLVLSVFHEGTHVNSSDGGTPEENVVMQNPPQGELTAVTCAFAATAPTPYRGRLTLTAAEYSSPPAGPGNASGAPPRFQNYAPDYPIEGFGMFGGEASVDVNWNTDSIFYIGFLETLRLKLDESTSPAKETWEIRSGPASSKATSDPILIGDPETGRIFALQLLFPEGQSAMDYTDTDGESWVSGMAGAIGSGVDHQSLGLGPYPAGSTISHPDYPNAIYYCSQDIAVVFCSRSDDGGTTFGDLVPIYTLSDCQGLHGHVKVAPDGTVYVPVSGCPSGLVDAENSQPALIVSIDAGLTWAVRKVTTSALGSGGHGADPSLGIASDGTLYMAYVDARNGHMRMAVGTNRGANWTNDVDIGGMTGINFAQFPAAVAGDPQRGAVAFFGSTYNGPAVDTAENFPGTWQLYLAATYDGGATYHVVDITPGDPIQRGGICGGGFCRNLLDFFDAVVDPEGRILIGYEDGCVGGCPRGSPGTFSDQVAIARQSGGRRMVASFDPVEPALPGAPLVSGYRNVDFAVLEWPAVDGGGLPVIEYSVYRSTDGTTFTLHKAVGAKRQFVDTGLDAATNYTYRVTARTSLGESAQGNALLLEPGDNLPMFSDACTLPGFHIANDRTGESEAAPLSRDIAKLYVAEPEAQPGMLVFTIQFAQAAPPRQGDPTARVFFDLPNGGKHMRLQVASGGGTSYGRLDQHPVTGVHNTFFQEGTLDAATYQVETIDGATVGTLRMVIAKSKLGLQTGDTLLGIYATTWPGAASANVTTEEAGYVDYKLRGNDFCALGGIIPPPPVDPPPPGPAAIIDPDNNRLGGAVPLATLALMLLASLYRRMARRR